MFSRCFRSTYPFDVPDVPDVQTVVVVHTGQLVVSLVIRQRDRVRVARVVWLAEHVTAIKKNIIICQSVIIRYEKCWRSFRRLAAVSGN